MKKKLKEKQLDGNKVFEDEGKKEEASSSLAKEEKVNSPTPTPKNGVDQMTIIKKLRKIPELVHMYDALHFSPLQGSRWSKLYQNLQRGMGKIVFS